VGGSVTLTIAWRYRFALESGSKIEITIDSFEPGGAAGGARERIPVDKHIIAHAIRDKAIVEFSYRRHRRRVEPYLLGVDDGIVRLFGFQLGDDETAPEWRRYTLADVVDLRVTALRFDQRRSFAAEAPSNWARTLAVIAG